MTNQGKQKYHLSSSDKSFCLRILLNQFGGHQSSFIRHKRNRWQIIRNYDKLCPDIEKKYCLVSQVRVDHDKPTIAPY